VDLINKIAESESQLPNGNSKYLYYVAKEISNIFYVKTEKIQEILKKLEIFSF